MKNSASNPSGTQVISQTLRVQAAQLLPVLTAVFTDLGYYEIVQQRISKHNNHNTTSYQGLIGAQHSQFGCVMIKWELSNSSGSKNFSGLSHEINVLIGLEKYQKIKNNPVVIAPPVLSYDSLKVNFLNLNQQLTILVMPYYSQGSLAHQLSNEEYKLLTAEQKYQLIMHSAHLIAVLHNSGWLHNDIKPSNILLDSFLLLNKALTNNVDNSSTTVKLLLTDFSLATCLDEGFDRKYTINTAGTPAYLAPERWQGQSATKQSDIYTFGIMMYEILTGMRPFNMKPQSSEPLKDWATQHCQEPVQLLPKESQRYQPIINKVLAKRVERRYKSMEEVLWDLKEV